MINFVRRLLDGRKWARWNNTPKDLVILHTFGKTDVIPTASPFILKVLTYLRLSSVPYKLDSKDSLGPKGKAPWISLNGQHIGDSELIIAKLNEHFKVDLNKHYTEKELAIAQAARVMLEEHFVWGLILERFVYNQSQFKKVISVGPVYDTLFMKFAGRIAAKRALGHGMGSHSKEEVEYFSKKDLRALSTLLGNNKYILGDKLCQEDCAVFGMLANVLWGLPNSPYQHFVNHEFKNLRDYCWRMKEEVYPDWNKLIRKPEQFEKMYSKL